MADPVTAALVAACVAAGGAPGAADADVLSYVAASLADVADVADAVDCFGEMLVEAGAVPDADAARTALASVVGGALMCWAVSVPVVAAVVARVSEPFLAALAAGGGTSPPPAAAAGAAGRRGGDDVGRAPLRARGG
jgi:hypothetical protein